MPSVPDICARMYILIGCRLVALSQLESIIEFTSLFPFHHHHRHLLLFRPTLLMHSTPTNIGCVMLCSAIWLTWLIITTTAIPVAVSHGVLNYPYEGNLYTTCMFLSSLGYNLRYFQVRRYITIYTPHIVC